jgi:hypothetical protein
MTSSPEVTRLLLRSITFARNPACLGSNGGIEHWKVEIWGQRIGSIKWPFEVTGELEWIDVPDKWDDFTLIPAHQIRIPGVRVDTQPFKSLQVACKRAMERALVLSGYMGPEFPHTLTIVRSSHAGH